MAKRLSARAQQVQDVLNEMQYDFQVLELGESTRSAVEAAQAVGCRLGQIVKSLIFRGKKSGRGYLVMASGENRVDTKKVRDLVSENVKMADVDFVREMTGFAIGGVAPVGHRHRLEAFIDEDLLRFETVWAAAGTPRSLFELSPDDLIAMTGGKVAQVK